VEMCKNWWKKKSLGCSMLCSNGIENTVLLEYAHIAVLFTNYEHDTWNLLVWFKYTSGNIHASKNMVILLALS